MTERLQIQGLWDSRLQGFRTIAGMVSIVTAVLAGSATALLIGTAAGESLGTAITVGAAVAILGEIGLMLYQRGAWIRASAEINAPEPSQPIQPQGPRSPDVE